MDREYYDSKGEYTQEAWLVIKYINELMKEYGIDIYELEAYERHDCRSD
jgi:hypothetical protein